MIIAPLDQQDVLATFPDDVAYLVIVLFHVLDEYLLTRSLRSINANEQYVITGIACTYAEQILLSYIRFF